MKLKPYLLVLTLISTAAFVSVATASENTWADIKQETSETMKAIGGYTAEKRDDFVAGSDSVIKKIDQRMEALNQKIESSWDTMSAASRKQATETRRALRVKRNQLGEWFGGVKHTGGEAWEDTKQGFIGAYHSIEEGFDQAEDEFE